MTVGSKWGYTYTADWRVDADPAEVKDLAAATLRRQLAESRALLGRHLRLYQIHSATRESGVLEDREVLEELLRVREEGIDRRVGHRAAAGGDALACARGGIFDTVQATWNLLERSAGAALADAHAAGLGVIQGGPRQRSSHAARWRPPPGEDRRGAETTPDALALAAALAQPWSDVVLSGATTREQLRSNLARSSSATTTSLTAVSYRSLRSRPSSGRAARLC